MRISLSLALGLIATSCGGVEEEPEPQHEALDSVRPQPEMRAVEDGDEESPGLSDRWVEGIVRVVGNDPSPQVVLSIRDDAAMVQIGLVGDLRNELGRLSGVAVEVIGDSVANPRGIPAHAIDVFEYDVLSVNSEPAYLGVLVNRDGVWWLDRDEPLELLFLPSDLEGRAGAKVWVAGPLAGDELRVQSYGIVREP